MNLRELKAQARTALHERMKVRAVRYSGGPSGPSETVYCRLNSKIAQTGDLVGTSLGYAEGVETEPKLIFLKQDVIPKRGEVYVLAPGEAYRVDHLEPDDTITITAICARLQRDEAKQYPYEVE